LKAAFSGITVMLCHMPAMSIGEYVWRLGS